MKAITRIAALLGVAALLPAAPRAAAAADTPLTQTLAKLDAASQRFSSAQADFEWDTYQRIVNDTDKQYGTIWFKRTNGGTEMRADVGDSPGAKPDQIVIYTHGELELYQPAIDDMKVFEAGKNNSQYESFLTLGFGGSGADLARNWDITYLGAEVMQSVSVAKLDLKPKQPSVAKLFSHITIWVDPERGVSLQQKFFYPTGDYRTAIYKNISMKGVDSGRFVMPKKKSTKIEHMQ